MGNIPEMTAEERARHDEILDSAFGESSFHMSFQTGCNTCTGGKCPGCKGDFAEAKTPMKQEASAPQTRQEWLDSLPTDSQTGRNEVQEYRLRYGAY